MARILRHRGPDGEGFHFGDKGALMHRRLSIIDLETGGQPIGNEDGSLQLVCNGEIYNSPLLRKELEERGHRFRTHSDVEVILHLYEEMGKACVRRLQGMFAFAILHVKSGELFLARDHMGQKPLFHMRVGDRFLFASEVKALLALGLVERKVDLNALWHYISLRFIPDDLTLFEGIHKLPAATTLFHDGTDTTIERYWSPDFRDKRQGREEELVDALDELLSGIVESHLLSDVPVGAFLSGGIDSSTVSAMIAGRMEEPLQTFSIGVREQDYNELPYARMVAERYGMDFNEKVVSADLVELIPRMVYHLDEPSDPFGVGVYLVSGIASEKVKVCMGGDGGDENFAGYDRYAGQRLVELYSVFPAWMRREVFGRLFRMVPDSFGYKTIAQKLAWLNEMSFYRSGGRYAQSMSFLRFTQERKEKLFTTDARARIPDLDSAAKILRHFDADNVEDLVDRMLHTDLMTRMPDHLLPIVDRMSMAHSLEVRSPLVDRQLVEFAASLPAGLKLRGRELKYGLKQVARRYLPSEVIDREKQGFGFPLARWMRTDLAGYLRRMFDDSMFVQEGIFDPGYIRQLLDEHLGGAADHNFRIWILMNLEIWYRIHILGRDTGEMVEYSKELLRAA